MPCTPCSSVFRGVQFREGGSVPNAKSVNKLFTSCNKGSHYPLVSSLEKGYFLYASRNRQNAEARFHSPYFSSNNTCVEFFHQIRNGRLKVYQGLLNKRTKVWERGRTISTDWERGYVALPDGYIRVTLEAVAEDGKVNIALDDVKISKCKPSMYYIILIANKRVHHHTFLKFHSVQIKYDDFMFDLY